ncbi:MAG: C25 family cysteine peptidase [Candidatus Zixiibacteriota bacterium]
MLLFQGIIFANISLTENSAGSFKCQFTPDKPSGEYFFNQKEPHFETAFFALPEGAVIDLDITIMQSSEEYLEYASNEINDAFAKRVGKMRNVPVGLLYIPVYYQDDDGQIRRIEKAEITITFDSQFSPASELVESEIYDDVFENLFLNHSVLPRDLHGLPGSYIIITPEVMVDDLEPFIEMKKKMGYLVNVFTLEEIGDRPDEEEIRNFLLDKYETIVPKPDLVLLIGDTRNNDGTIFRDYGYTGSGGTYASDNAYALFDDSDFIPDVLLGRFTATNETYLQTIVQKNLTYTYSPDEAGTDWLKRGLIVAENTHAMSPILNAMWTKEILERNGFTRVDSIFERTGYPVPSASQINDAFDRGVAFTTYRGWGSSQGWWNPEYMIPDVYDMNNSPYYGIITTIVCGTGDFRRYGTPCFSEVLLQHGSPARPRGAVAVYAPSDHNTHTRYNNPLNVGFYEAVFGYDLTMLGQASLGSRLNEYLYLPLEMESVEHYFYVYNNFGDPGLYMWSGKIDSLTIDAPETLVHWGGEIQVSVDPPVADVWVSLYYDDTGMQAVGKTNEMGIATIAYPHEAEMFAKITAWKKHYKPVEKDVYIWRRGGEGIDFVSCTVDDFEGDGDGKLEPGETANLSFTLNNPGPYLSNGDFYLGAYNEYIEVADGLSSIVIPEGEFTIDGYSISLDSDMPYTDNLELWLTVMQLDTVVRYLIPCEIPFNIGKLEISDKSLTGSLSTGETANLDIELINSGEGTVGPMELRLITESGFLTLSDNIFEIPAILPGDTYLADEDIILMPHLIDGVIYPMRLVDMHGNTIGTFELSSGEGGPTGPDGWGYMAFDQTDADYPTDVEWTDISEIGTANFVRDDWTIRREMPFPLKFYGDSYDSISICSNGWIAPGNIAFYLIDFYNLPIPGPGGPWGIIAPHWDDLEPLGGTGENLYTYHDTENDVFIIQWDNFVHVREDHEQTFQVMIFNEESASGDNPIAFLYNTTSDNDSAHTWSSVGIEDIDHKIGLEYRYSNIYTGNSTPFEDDFGIYITNDVDMARLSGDYYPENIQIMTEYGQKPRMLNDGTYLFNQIRSGEDIFIYATAEGYFRDEQIFNLPVNTEQAHDFILEEIPMPRDLSAIGADTSITISWTEPVSTEHELTGYNIYRSRTPYSTPRFLDATTETEYTDSSIDEGFYWYSITATYGYDESRLTEAVSDRSMMAIDENGNIPQNIGLSAPSPNPFNASVSFDILLKDNTEKAMLEITDIEGRIIRQIDVGKGRIVIDAENWGSGIYFARLIADKDVYTRKMLLVK